MNPYGLGAHESKKDIRDFVFKPTYKYKVGLRYQPEDIEHQHKVGICTAISLTQQARKVRGRKFSADFQYLMQKIYEGNWDEGSSARSALWVASKIGLLPEEEWHSTNEEDRKLPYSSYIKKLQKVSQVEIDRLKSIAANHKIVGYEAVPINRDMLAEAIDESDAGIIVRYEVGEEWWTEPIEPLRAPKQIVSGHLIIESNITGTSGRVANTWGSEWADKGTAYHFFTSYVPTEAWLVHYNEVPGHVEDQQKKLEGIYGSLIKLLNQLIQALSSK